MYYELWRRGILTRPIYNVHLATAIRLFLTIRIINELKKKKKISYIKFNGKVVQVNNLNNNIYKYVWRLVQKHWNQLQQ
jgi:hypothetical protein